MVVGVVVADDGVVGGCLWWLVSGLYYLCCAVG